VLPDAVCQLLASDGARQFDVLEQAAFLRELKLTHRMSQNEIALRMGRHPSWVSRRLLLIEQLPAAAMEAVRAGWLSTWSASRVLAPLARANPQHAQALVAAVKNNALTSRQLLGFWQVALIQQNRVRNILYCRMRQRFLSISGVEFCQTVEKSILYGGCTFSNVLDGNPDQRVDPL
jgi:hypothetical protein